ncbi:MAG: hypothetical protein NC416_02885 [Eubacterium sp.]|nr:hypothetical protein [Eubacterium sp.]
MEIAYFTINNKEVDENGYQAATGEKVKLSWKCDGCDACVIYPYGWKRETEGSMEICVYQPMTFLLRAHNHEGSVQREIHVKINGQEQLESVSVSPQGPVEAGKEITFQFCVKNTNYGYLDHGIGRVEGNSYTQLLRDNYSVYRYSILSGSTDATTLQEQMIKAGRSDALALDRLKYILMREGNSQTYLIDWRIVNHGEADVLLEVTGQSKQPPEVSYHEASGYQTFQREGGDICTLSVQCRTTEGEEIHFSSIYPFEIHQTST